MKKDTYNMRYFVARTKEKAIGFIEDYYKQFGSFSPPEVFITVSRLDTWLRIQGGEGDTVIMAGSDNIMPITEQHDDGGITVRPERLRFKLWVPLSELPPARIETTRGLAVCMATRLHNRLLKEFGEKILERDQK